MALLRRLAVFLYEFLVGDDPRIAVGVVLALAVTALVAGAGVPAWWVLPAAVVAVLGFSIHRITASVRNRPNPRAASTDSSTRPSRLC